MTLATSPGWVSRGPHGVGDPPRPPSLMPEATRPGQLPDTSIAQAPLVPRIASGAVLSRMPGRQRSRRRFRRMPLRATSPRSLVRRIIMTHQRDGFITAAGTRLDQPPAQVDVLTGGHGLVEATDVAHGRAPADDGGAGHVRTVSRGSTGASGAPGPATNNLIVAGDRVVLRSRPTMRGAERHRRDREKCPQ